MPSNNVDWSQYESGGEPEELEVISPGEAQLRQQSGGYGPDGRPVTNRAVIDTAGTKTDWSKYAAVQNTPKPVPPKEDELYDPEGDEARALAASAPSVVRGIAKGAAAPVTIPADVAIWGTNAIKKVINPSASPLETDASDVLGSVLDKFGLKKAPGILGTAGEITGSLLGGATNPSFGKDINPGKWWSWANPTSQVNNDVLGNAVRQSLGVASKPGEYGVTADVMKQAQDAYKGALDVGRNSKTFFQDNPRTIATSLASIAKDAGYEKDTLTELMKRPEVTKLFRILQDGRATTEQLGNASSALGASAAGTSDSILRNTLFKFRDYTEDAIKSSLSPNAAAIYEQGLQKYKAYQQLTGSGALNTTTGELNPVKLLNSIKNDADWVNGTNKSPLYQVLRHVESGQKAVDSMMESVPGKLGYAIRTAAKTIPGVAQSIVQRGIPETLRAIANHPGFLQSLGGNSDANADNIPDSAGQNP